MECFLSCFGGTSKHRHRHSHRRRCSYDIQSTNQSKADHNDPQAVKDVVERHSAASVTRIEEKQEEQSNTKAVKKVRFDSNVQTYEHVSLGDITEMEIIPDAEDNDQMENNEEASTPSDAPACSMNHRYEDCIVGDIDGDDKEETVDRHDKYDGEIVRLRRVVAEKIHPEMLECSPSTKGVAEREVKPNRNLRDRSCYVHPVLNPVENLTQWKAVKAKDRSPLKKQKENFQSLPTPRISPRSARNSGEEDAVESKPSREMAVDASLSNWLGPLESAPTPSKEKARLSDSSPPQCFEDRPILGALTVDELKQFSASSSPRRSPTPTTTSEETPIIGTVGSYWNHVASRSDSSSPRSCKGIPNTTSKYREDKRVNWYSTPFETRLERALKGEAV